MLYIGILIINYNINTLYINIDIWGGRGFLQLRNIFGGWGYLIFYDYHVDLNAYLQREKVMF